MTDRTLPERNIDGNLPAHAWPGGYPIFYLDKEGNVLCPTCASRPIDQQAAVIAADINWEDASMLCDDCGKQIESAYAEPAQSDAADQRCQFCRDQDIFRNHPDGTPDRTTCRHTGM